MAASPLASSPEVAREVPTSPSALGLLYAALVVQSVISAGTYLAAKRAMGELDPITLVTCRFALSGLIFCVILSFLPGRALPPRNVLRRLLYLGALAGPINQGCFFYGLSRSNPAHASLLYALTPISVFLISIARGRERASRQAFVGIAVAFTGVVVLLLGRGLKSAGGPLVGDLFILAAVVAWAFYTADGRELILSHGPLRATAWSLITAALLVVPGIPFFFNLKALSAASTTVYGCIVYLAVLTSIVSYLLWYFALSKVPASRVAVFSNLQPVTTAIAAWAVLGEPLHWEIGVGGILVLAGVRLTQRT